MLKITFQKENVKELEQRLAQAYDEGQLRLVRKLAVLLGIARRECLAEVLRAWHLTRQTAYNWFESFVEKRFESLTERKPSGRPARLTKSQKQQLYEAVQAGPEAAGYRCGCWTTVMIQEWIFKQFGVLYSRYYVAELLRNLGLSYQKARFISGHLDEAARKQWLETHWPAILTQAQTGGLPIFFADEASFAQWGSLAYTWAPKGQQPEVKTSGIRKGYKVLGVIEFFSGRFYYYASEERFDSYTYCSFLYALLTSVPERFILIQDGASYHTSKATRDFIQKHSEQLIVYQLPAYSPEYNPIEHLWKKIKTKATHNRFFEQFERLIEAVEEALADVDAHSEEILCLMGVYTKQRPVATSA